MTARRLCGLVAAGALIAPPLQACSDGSGTGDGTSPVTVTITEHNGSVTSDADLVKANTGQQRVLKVTSDAPDEIHVHSVPDHEFEVTPGKAETFTFSVSTPGTIEVESHGLDQQIFKLEIS